MRIVSGLFKSRLIRYPEYIRPTQDKIRGALFNVLRPYINNSLFLELFAGSGAVGIEALSNGAQKVVFVEKDKRCCKVIENNLVQLGLIKEKGQSRGIINYAPTIFSKDALEAIDFFYKNNKKFDIIFMDPPYYKESASRLCSGSTVDEKDWSLAKKTLQKLSACDILAPDGIIVVEHSKKDFLEETIDSITCFRQKRYGDTVLSFYKHI